MLSKFFKFSLPIGIAGIALNLILFATNFYYELVIPIFESSMTDGPLFTFVDNLVFFTPCTFMVLFLAYLIAGLVYKKKHQEKAEDKVTEKLEQKNTAIQKELDEKLDFLSYKLYTNCPSCGAPRAEDEKACRFCGASLIIEKRNIH